jgi:RND family efflux transporter MFP subunit
MPRWRRALRLLGGTVLVAFLAALAAGCTRAPEQAKGNKPVDVEVTRPITDEVTDYQDFTGRLDAFKTVEMRARVSGYILDAPFKEGDDVHKGDVLFQIDPRPYKATLDSAEARLAAARAQVLVNESNLKLALVTYQRARKAGIAATALELDQDRIQQQVSEANLNLAKANVNTAQADLETARLNLEWTTVRAPWDGRISRRNVDPGNLVTADNTMLTTIVTDTPVYAYFDVDERTFLDLQRAAKPRPGSTTTAGLQFPVLIQLANEKEFTPGGTINFVDNRVNGNTGTIRMRAVIENAGRFLKPGLFVRIRVPVSDRYPAVLVPDEALLSDQGLKFVYTVNDKGVARYRAVVPGQAVKGLRVIKRGLAAGERVIIKGVQKVKDGTPVVVTKEETPKRQKSPVSRLLQPRAAPGKPAGAS